MKPTRVLMCAVLLACACLAVDAQIRGLDAQGPKDPVSYRRLAQVPDGEPVRVHTILKKESPSPPPPPKNKDKNKNNADTGGTSTTTIIIAVAAGVGGLVAIVLVTVIWCSCCRKKKAPKGTPVKGSPSASSTGKLDSLEEGSHVPAADIYKSDLRAQQAAMMPPQAARMASARVPSTHHVQAVPIQLLEPQDLGPRGASGVMAAAGPLAVGAAAGTTVAAAATASRSTSSARTQSRSVRPPAPPAAPALPVAEASEYNDALLTWIGGQMSREKEAEAAASAGAKLARRATSTSQRSRYDDVSAYEIPFDALRMGKLLGEGSFGKVYLASWNETPVAVKVLVDASSALDKGNDPMRLRRLAEPVLDKLAAEAGLMASMRHPNIIAFMGIVGMPPCVVTELCERGSLCDVLRRARKGDSNTVSALGWRARLSMAADAATGMLYLHSRKPAIIHRDLKSPNLLVDSHWRVKVADFNMSRIMEESGQGSSLAGTNPRWLAPELMAGESATTASDVFAMGVVLWELLTWELPWAKDNPWSVAHTVGNGGRLPIPLRWDLPGVDTNAFARVDDYIALVQRCWAHNPYDRPTFQEIIQELRGLEAAAPMPAMDTAGSSGSLPRGPSSGNLAAGTTTASTVPRPATVEQPPAPPVQRPPSQQQFSYAEYPEDDDYDYEYEGGATDSIDSTAVMATMDDHAKSLYLTKGRSGSWGRK